MIIIQPAEAAIASIGEYKNSPQQEFYRVKITLITESDWSKLLIKSSERFVNARLEIVEGENAPDLHVFWSEKKIGISKKAFDKSKVEIDCVIILVGLEKGTDVKFEIQRGSIGYTTVKIYNFNGDKPILLRSFTRSETVPGSELLNPFGFPVPAELLMEGGPLRVESRVPKLAWAFYYPWYTVDSWEKDFIVDQPILGKYISSEKSTILRHIILAKAAGIDGFIVSWWGPGTYSDGVLPLILEVSEIENFKICIYLETLKDVEGVGVPRDPPEIEEMLETFFTKYGNSKAYYRLDGKPVVFIWAANSYPPETWKKIFDQLKLKGYSAKYVAESLKPEYLKVFDGLHVYNPIRIQNIKNVYGRMAVILETYPLLGSSKEEKIWAATICPGYDERLLPKRAGFYQDRWNGQYYKQTFDAAKSSKPDWLLITSFNEWPENTYIEPSEKYGFDYILLTEKFIAEFKSRESNPRSLLDLKADWRKNSTLNLFLSKTVLSVDEELVVFGSLAPAEPGDLVHILTSTSGVVFTRIAEVEVDADGNFSYRLKAFPAGKLYVQALWDGDEYRRPSQSAPEQVTINKIPTSITISVTPGKVYRGEAIKVAGLLFPAIPKASVTITYEMPRGGVVDRTVITASDGSFTDTYKLDELGNWVVTANWKGDEKYKGATSQSLTCVVEESPYVIAGWIILAAVILIAGALFLRKRLQSRPAFQHGT
jgi:hypothetical protein